MDSDVSSICRSEGRKTAHREDGYVVCDSETEMELSGRIGKAPRISTFL